MYNSLLALRKLVKRYEYKPKEQRHALHDIIQNTFPLIQQLMSSIILSNVIEAAQVMRMCFKIFWSCTMYKLPPLQDPVVDLNMWFQLIATIIDKKLPEASEGVEPFGQPISIEDRKAWPWWKVFIFLLLYY
jgi:hypothetical protein